METTRLGDILLARRWIGEAELADAMALQVVNQQPLGQILLAQARISERQLKRALRWQRFARGAVLVSSLGATLSPALASEALRMTEQMMLQAANHTAPVKQKKPKNKTDHQTIQANLRSLLGTPAWTLLQGQYQLGADAQTEGLSYRAKWSSSSVKLELRYQF